VQTQHHRTDAEAHIVDAAKAPPQPRRSLDDTIPLLVVGLLSAAWVAGLAWIFAIAPEADPDEPIGALDFVLSSAMFASWLAVFSGLGTRRRFGITATIGGGVLLAVGGVVCGLTGHTGLWIPVQIGVGLGLAGTGTVANRLT
jgi:hypothetical protein